MSWGSAFRTAYSAASEKAKQAATTMMSSAKAAGEAVSKAADATRDAGVAAAKATGNALVKGARIAKDGAVTTGKAVGNVALATGKGVANVAKFGGRVVVEGTMAAGKHLTSFATAPARIPYETAKKLFSPALSPRAVVSEPCPNTEEGKRRRLAERKRLIAAAGSSGASSEKRAAAERLQRNNEAVELARLSGDTYDQYGQPPKNDPPPGWTRVSDQELKERGLDQLVKDSKAAIYKTPPDWPGGEKTVLAFRGTADKEDAIVDHDQAMGNATAQYAAASQLGIRVQKEYGSSVLVTGHSLGGGKAQAAGATGGLKGTMFNSAGLHPNSVGGVLPGADQFQQYRTTNDPLTGVQNSALAQAGAAGIAGPLGALAGLLMKGYDTAGKLVGLQGLSPEYADYADKAVKLYPRALRNIWNEGDVAPPAIGGIKEVPAIDKDGKLVSPYDPMGQHSMDNLVNGIEQQKSEDVATLQGD